MALESINRLLPMQKHMSRLIATKSSQRDNRFHYCRYIHWAVDEVRRKQKEWHAYDRKKSGAYAICFA